MRYLDLTLPTLAENLALDEALLDEAETANQPSEALRIWEAREHAVVIGRSSRKAAEVRGNVCSDPNVPVLRRISGGAAVVVGPGCLMYAVVLSLRLRPQLRSINQAHAQVLGALVSALRPSVPDLALRGICDLSIGEKKVSGNSMRCKRDHLLYHGTLLYDFSLEMIGRCLAMPPREPDYRQSRPHDAFVANLPLDAARLRFALQTAWTACEPRSDWPQAATQQLVAEKYSRTEWNEQLG
ncbi:MAG: biotin/lipoate A/B protein ligase family protein [Thermoguttaceae bacterium]